MPDQLTAPKGAVVYVCEHGSYSQRGVSAIYISLDDAMAAEGKDGEWHHWESDGYESWDLVVKPAWSSDACSITTFALE